MMESKDIKCLDKTVHHGPVDTADRHHVQHVNCHQIKVELSHSMHRSISMTENSAVLLCTAAVGDNDQEIHTADPVSQYAPTTCDN